MSELAPTQALQDMGGHGALCLAASAQATLGDRRGGDRARWDRSPPAHRRTAPCPPPGISWALSGHRSLLQPGRPRLDLAAPTRVPRAGFGPCNLPAAGLVTPGQGHHDPAELVLCHLGSLGKVLGVLPPAPPRLPPPGGKQAPLHGARVRVCRGGGHGDGTDSGEGKGMGVQADAGPASSGQ